MKSRNSNSSASQVHRYFMDDGEWKDIYMDYVQHRNWAALMLLLKDHGYRHSFDHAVALIKAAS